MPPKEYSQQTKRPIWARTAARLLNRPCVLHDLFGNSATQCLPCINVRPIVNSRPHARIGSLLRHCKQGLCIIWKEVR